MKVCPRCKTQYTDDSLMYCLQDGTRLVPSASPETETVVRPRIHGDEAVARTEITQAEQPNSRPKPRTTIIIALLSMLLAAAAIVLVLGVTWMLWRPSPLANNTSGVNDRNLNQPVNANHPSPTPTPSPTASVTIGTPTPFLNTIAVRDVEATIESWRQATTAMDSDLLMENYADTVNYYKIGPVSADFVRKDKQRAFSIFTLMIIKLSNMNISIDASGDRATAEFDKEWDFQGKSSLSGKARSQLRLFRTNGRWLITAEQDLRVYRLDGK